MINCTSPTVAASTSTHPDATLLELGEKFEQACRALKSGSSELDQLGLSPAQCGARFEELCAALDPIEDEILQTPATTIAGLIVKARAATRWGICADDHHDGIAHSMIVDLLSLDERSESYLPRSRVGRITT